MSNSFREKFNFGKQNDMFINTNNYIRMTSLLFNAMGIGMTRHDFTKRFGGSKKL